MNSDDDTKKCSKGQILRKGYITKTQVKVPSSCIIAQSADGKKTSKRLSRYLKNKNRIHEKVEKLYKNTKKCSRGQIKRVGYSKKSYKSHSKNGKIINVKGYNVAPNCINSITGKSKKGTKLITIMDKDVLGKFGYHNIKNLNQSERHSALKKAIEKINPLSVYRRIIALATLNKNNKIINEILIKDANFIKTQEVYKKSRQESAKKSFKLLTKKIKEKN
jgi:hypothetical protein